MKSKSFILIVFIFSLFMFACQEMGPTNVNTDKQATNIQDLSRKDGDIVADQGTTYTLTDHFIVEYDVSTNRLRAEVEKLGGSVEDVCTQIGIAKLRNFEEHQAKILRKVKGIKAVNRDVFISWSDPNTEVIEAHIGEDEGYWPYQWGPHAISAPDAWDAGFTGEGVRVAVIDGGISSGHFDLVNNIDFTASASFVPGYSFDDDDDSEGPFRHATHVAGIIAAENNQYGTIGIAPNATIVALKALHGGSGSFFQIVEAILYAADEADADIINMSLGALVPRNGYIDDNDTPEDPKDDFHVAYAPLINYINSAVTYAYQKGVTVVASAGNDGLDMDHLGPWIHIPGELSNAINVSATGPLGYYYGSSDYDVPSFYTNYGQSEIDFAAPGGNWDFDLPYPAYVYDWVLSPGAAITSYYFAYGTSMAAPHVSGVAALIIGKNGGSMHPAQVEAALRRSADDLGKPGKDDYYGHGRVNAYNAVN